MYVTGERPCLRSQNSAAPPAGPGRINAINAIKSSNEFGATSVVMRVVMAPSNWKTPIVSPCCSRRNASLVFERDFVDGERRILASCQINGSSQDGQRRQTEEVHLEESDLLEQPHLILGRDFAFALASCSLQGNGFDQRITRDDDSGRMGRRMAGDSFHFLGVVDQLAQSRLSAFDRCC